jgi:hypothetical protein
MPRRTVLAGTSVARLLVRVHREDNSTSFFDNLGEHPITSSQWSLYQIAFPVDADSRDIEFGIQLYGEGAAWIDSVSVTSPVMEIGKAIRVGRSNLERMWSGATGQAKPKRTIQSVEVLTPDIAVMRVLAEFADPSERFDETFLLAREGGEWRSASIRP